MRTTPPAEVCATSLIDALVETGVRDFVLSPGSRSAPLALALADREVRGLLRLHVRMDERSAGFFALGIARGSDRPVAVVCTSGSAVANLHPAVIEADYSAVPLLLLTADRPAELRGVGASQTIKQAEIFGDSVRWFEDVAAPETGERDEVDQWWNLAVEAEERASGERGPVHLNLAFRPPLVGGIPAPMVESVLAANTAGNASDSDPEFGPGQGLEPKGAREREPDRCTAAGLDQDLESKGDRQLRGDTQRVFGDQGSWEQDSPSGDWVQSGELRHGLFVVGDLPVTPGGSTDLSSDILRLAEELGWPVIAEPTANLAEHPNVLSHGSLIAGSAEFIANHRPDLVVSVGRFGLSRAVTSLVAGAKQHWALAVDGRGEPADPGLSADRNLTALPTWTRTRSADPSRIAAQTPGPPSVSDTDVSPSVETSEAEMASVLSAADAVAPDPGWLADWTDADRAVGRVIREELLGAAESDEPDVSMGHDMAPEARSLIGDAESASAVVRGPGLASAVAPVRLSGAGAALAVWDSVLADETVFLASSWPIRFIDSFARGRNVVRVLANRGANGIDGLVSTTLGIATAASARERILDAHVAAGSGSAVQPWNAALGPVLLTANAGRTEPREVEGPSAGVVAILGDIAFLHDIGGLVGAGQREVSAVLVVLNNDGGGIFSQLEQAAPQYERDFERVFGTPHGQDLAGIAKSMGVSARDVRDLPDLQDALSRARATGGVHVIVAHTSDRREEVALLRHVASAASAAINEIGE